MSEAKRNATVVATSDAELLRLDKADFDQLLREPLLRRLRFEEAIARVRDAATPGCFCRNVLAASRSSNGRPRPAPSARIVRAIQMSFGP